MNRIFQSYQHIGVLITVCAVGTLSGAAQHAASRGKTLREVTSFNLPGPVGKRFDYLTVDEKHGRLFSGHMGAGLLYVIDMRTNTVLHTISDVPGVEGVEYIPGMNKVYTSDSYEQKIGVVDLAQRKVVKKLSTEAKPDGGAYAAPFRKVYVSDERGKAEAVIDVNKDVIVKTIFFESETGMPQYDPIGKRVLVNLQDKNLLAEIDPATDTVVARYPVGTCIGNHGMALDVAHRRAFLSCEGNDTLTVFDLEKHVPIAYLPMAAGPDVVKFDPGPGRIYVACYSGAISVFQEDDPDHFRKLEDFPVQRRVHSLAVDLKTHRVYTPEEQENGKPESRMIVYEAVVHP